jgi:hypothetical protein
MRSSSLATTILHENLQNKESTSDTDNNQQIEKHSSPIPTDNLLFNAALTTNSKSSFWTVTDRQPEWYKLSIPINSSLLNHTNQIVPFKKLSKTSERKKSKSTNTDQIDRPT